MDDKDRLRIAEMWCELNCWETPKEIRQEANRNLTRAEIPGAMAALEVFITKKERLDAWAQGGGTVPRKPRVAGL